MAKLTYKQKLDALSYRFYQGAQWSPKAGDFYTTSRADLGLCQVVSVEGGIVRTRFTEGSDAISEWQEDGFLTEGFGPKRVFVPPWVINAPPQANAEMDLADVIRRGIKDQGYGYVLKGDKLTVSSDEVFAIDIRKLADFINAAAANAIRSSP